MVELHTHYFPIILLMQVLSNSYYVRTSKYIICTRPSLSINSTKICFLYKFVLIYAVRYLWLPPITCVRRFPFRPCQNIFSFAYINNFSIRGRPFQLIPPKLHLLQIRVNLCLCSVNLTCVIKLLELISCISFYESHVLTFCLE